jgi:hypothetical protein
LLICAEGCAALLASGIDADEQYGIEDESAADERGIPFRQFVAGAVRDKLKALSAADDKPWLKSFGKLRHVRSETEGDQSHHR